MKDARQVIIEPIVSEKSYALLEEGVYTFKVHPTASKPEIRDAVETIFGVSVTKVNTLNRKGKPCGREPIWGTPFCVSHTARNGG